MHGKTAPSCGLHSQGGVRRGVRASGSYQEGTGKSGYLTKLNRYDIIITATGVPGLISSSLIAPGTTVIDAGTASEDGILKGDLENAVYDRTDLAAITPKTGGVGPLTVSALFDHTIQATNSQTKRNP